MATTPTSDRRASRFNVTKEGEDSGLFGNGVTQVAVNLVPVIKETGRGDLAVRSFVEDGSELSVVFAGRRKADFAPLQAELRRILTEANYSAERLKVAAPPVNTLRIPAQVEGSWRVLFETDIATGEEHRKFYFMAARWCFNDAAGTLQTHGKQVLQTALSSELKRF